MVTAGLVLAGCGSSGAAGLVQDHTACPPVDAYGGIWSADGASIYYLLDVDGITDLRAVSPDGSHDRLLAHDIRGQPSLSPDGRLFLLERDDPAAADEVNYTILQLETLAEHQILHGERSGLDWAPDSRSLAVAQPFETGSGAFVDAPLLRVDPASGASTPLIAALPPGYSAASFPRWSPDGKSIAFMASGPAGYGMFSVSADGKTLTTLTSGAPPDCQPPRQFDGDIPSGWMPDGRTLAFARLCDSGGELRYLAPDGSVTDHWRQFPPGAVQISLSPDGKRAVFAQKVGPGFILYTAGADGSGAAQLRASALDPLWSTDGSLILATDDQTPANGRLAVFLMKADGSDARPLSHDPNAGRICLH